MSGIETQEAPVDESVASDAGTTPVAPIPERERIVWENRELAGCLTRSLAEAEQGDLIDRGD